MILIQCLNERGIKIFFSHISHSKHSPYFVDSMKTILEDIIINMIRSTPALIPRVTFLGLHLYYTVVLVLLTTKSGWYFWQREKKNTSGDLPRSYLPCRNQVRRSKTTNCWCGNIKGVQVLITFIVMLHNYGPVEEILPKILGLLRGREIESAEK